MNKTTLKYKDTGYFSKTVIDYLSQNDKIKSFYNYFPNLENFKKQIEQKQSQNTNRKVLVDVLNKQYKNLITSDKTTKNIQLLAKKNSFTVTTGHQLNLFTGPLYFLYKIISTINLCEDLTSKYPENNFVPIYWLATEDHDFEEIQYFNFKDKKIVWNRESSGAVGRLSTQGLDQILSELQTLFGTSKNAKHLLNLFKQSYLEHNNLTDATRFLTNELFKNYGLVILDADNKNLKQQFLPHIKDELFHQTAFKEVSKTNTHFGKQYKIQVNPREINLFYLTDDLRDRIILEDNQYKVNNTKIAFSKEDLLVEIENHPDKFSPNVIMRPLYQEVILPNLCYIGGGGELAYWLELKSYFEKSKISFPILLLRNSALIQTEKTKIKFKKLNILTEELFLKQTELVNKKIKETSNLSIDFSEQKIFLQNQFIALKEMAKKTDQSFIGAVNAQEKKQLKGLNNLEKRLLKAEKRKLSDLVNRIILLQNTVFPNKILQERHTNFSELYLEHGEELIPFLKDNLTPLQLEFSILTI